MLVLKRRIGEAVRITLPDGRRVFVTMVENATGQPCFGIQAPADIRVDREEVALRRDAEARTLRGVRRG